jgi:hypothetical protein
MGAGLSVVMGVYNCSCFLGETLDSILAQTYSDFEFICVDDGSTDYSLEILREYAERDSRIQIVEFPENLGVSCALNEAIARAHAPYIAIADSDDLYQPFRFERQVAFLEAHSDYVAVGSSMITIDARGDVLGMELMPERDASLRWRMLFDSPFLQPAITLRAQTLKSMSALYRPEYRAAEDYDLWTRILQHGKGYNFNEPFLFYRKRESSISHYRKAEQIRNRDAICSRLMASAFGDHGFTLEEINRLRHIFFNGRHPITLPTPDDVRRYLWCLRKFAETLPRETALRFLHEEQHLLGQQYWHQIGLADLNLATIFDSEEH